MTFLEQQDQTVLHTVIALKNTLYVLVIKKTVWGQNKKLYDRMSECFTFVAFSWLGRQHGNLSHDLDVNSVSVGVGSNQVHIDPLCACQQSSEVVR